MKLYKNYKHKIRNFDHIKNKINHHDDSESKILETVSQETSCVKCKTKRQIKNPEKTTMKKGRSARGFCSMCQSKVFKIGKMKK